MKQIFVDTSDLVAVFNRRDQLHEKAVVIEKDIRNVRKVTTELILIEVLNYFSEFRRDIEEYVTDSIGRYLTEDKIDIVFMLVRTVSKRFRVLFLSTRQRL